MNKFIESILEKILKAGVESEAVKRVLEKLLAGQSQEVKTIAIALFQSAADLIKIATDSNPNNKAQAAAYLRSEPFAERIAEIVAALITK